MITLELAKKAVERLAETAVTQKQFDAWKPPQQKQWLKDHPTSKFGKKVETKPAAKTKGPIKQADLKKTAKSSKGVSITKRLKARVTSIHQKLESLAYTIVHAKMLMADYEKKHGNPFESKDYRLFMKAHPDYKKWYDYWAARDKEYVALSDELHAAQRVLGYPPSVLDKIEGVNDLPDVTSLNGKSVKSLAKLPELVKLTIKGGTSPRYTIFTTNLEKTQNSKEVKSWRARGETVQIKQA